MTSQAPAVSRLNGGTAESAFEALGRQVRASVEARLRAVLDEAVVTAKGLAPAVEATVEALRSLSLRGGKRWRAVLLAAAYEGCGGEGGAERVVMAGVSFELLQSYLLIHDDWMDGDRTRRGGPSVHASLEERLGSEAMGAAAAVLAGDFASAIAQEALLAVPVAAPCLLDASREFARVQREVTLGQMVDLLAGDDSTLEVTYTLKTTSYTVRGPLLLGAALAGASKATRDALERHARPLGIAFQIRDDLLGAFGLAEVTGKPVGTDLRRGKPTALVTDLRGDAHGARLLERVFGVSDAPDDEVTAVLRRMVESGAKARVEARVDGLLEEALAALAVDAVPPSLRQVLTGAALALGRRER